MVTTPNSQGITEVSDQYQNNLSAGRQVRAINKQNQLKDRENLAENYSEDQENGVTKSTGEEISFFMSLLIYAVAVFFDLITLIIGLYTGFGGTIFSLFIGVPVMWFIYKSQGIDMGSGIMKKRFAGTAVIGILPWIDALPGFLLNAYLIISKHNEQSSEAN